MEDAYTRIRLGMWLERVRAGIVVAGLGASGIVGSGAVLLGEDWPGYLGARRDGVSAETGLYRQWPEGGPEELWRVSLGAGYSSAAVVDGRLFTMFAERGAEWAAAFDVRNGKELWRFQTGRNRRDSQGGGPRATPTVDAGRVYVMGAMAGLYCLDASTGKKLWGYDLRAELGARVPQWGVASSPLVDGDLLVVQSGGSKDRAFLGFDKRDGSLVWSSGSDLPGYSSPIAVTIGGVRQAIFFTAGGLVGVAVANGERLWHVPWVTSYDVNAATPIFVPDNGLFISSGYDTGAALLQVVREGAGFTPYQVWRSRVMRNHYNSSVRIDRHLYGFDEGILKCLDVLSGEELWRARAGGKGSVIYADGYLLVLGGDGDLSLVEASPEEFRSIAKARVIRDRTWAVPALADGVLFIRAWSELLALRVGAPVG